MNAVKIEREYKDATFGINEQGIRRFHDVIKNRIGGDSDIVFIARYSDNSSFKTVDIEEVLSEESNDRRSVKSLQIWCHKEDKNIDITFGRVEGKNLRTNMVLAIKGPTRDWVYITESILEDRFKSIKIGTWKLDFKIALMAALVIMSTIFIAPYTQNYLPLIYRIKSNGDIILGAGFLILSIIDILLFVFLAKIIENLYPDSIFIFGDRCKKEEDRRNANKNKILWTLIVGIPVAVVVDIILSVFL